MARKTFDKQDKQDMFDILDSIVQKYEKQGASLPQAISLVCKEYNFNPYKVIDTYYPEIKPEELNTYKDVKTEEGSFVTLKNDSTQKHYEVININNKDAIVLRNTDNNKEITASEEEITPVITENKMNKLNEAQYNISINGLETEDAATLSQMLSLADQAENVGGSVLASDGMQNDMALNPMPMDDMGMPMDMEAPVETEVEEPVVDDIEFDEELPSDDLNIEEPMDAEMEVNVDEDPVAMDSMVDDAMAEDLPMEEPIEDMSMDDMIDDGMYDDEIMGESFDYDALIKEAMEAAGIESLDEAEEVIPAGDDVTEEGEQEEYAEEIVESTDEEIEEVCEEVDFDEEIAEALRIAGVQLNEEVEEDDLELIHQEFMDGQDDESIKYELIHQGFASDDDEAQTIIDDWSKNDVVFDDKSEDLNEEYDEEVAEELEDLEETEDFDAEIAEALRLAGVQLDEAEASKPIVVDDETLYINKENEDQEPEYHEVETDTFGKEASEGMKTSMTFEAAVNTKKIESIYETAKAMYAKKDTSEWMSLDRRYVEKLIKEGVGYEKASKMIMNAKKGK